jgi:hypothetical protein
MSKKLRICTCCRMSHISAISLYLYIKCGLYYFLELQNLWFCSFCSPSSGRVGKPRFKKSLEYTLNSRPLKWFLKLMLFVCVEVILLHQCTLNTQTSPLTAPQNRLSLKFKTARCFEHKNQEWSINCIYLSLV